MELASPVLLALPATPGMRCGVLLEPAGYGGAGPPLKGSRKLQREGESQEAVEGLQNERGSCREDPEPGGSALGRKGWQ